MWWVAAVLVTSVFGALYFLGRDDESPATSAASRRECENITRTALNALAQSPEYAKWRAQKTAELDAQIKQAGEAARTSRRNYMIVFFVLAAYCLWQFPVCDGTSRCASWLARAAMVQAVACTDKPLHAAAFTATVAAYLVLNAHPLGVGYALWAGLVFLKMYLSAPHNPVKVRNMASEFEAYEQMDYDAIRYERYDDEGDW